MRFRCIYVRCISVLCSVLEIRKTDEVPMRIHLRGYFLGFFAAITVETNGVEIDCKGKSIRMLGVQLWRVVRSLNRLFFW